MVRVAWLTIRVPKDARARKKPTCGYPFATQIACILCSATEGTTFLPTCLNLHAKHLLGMRIYCLAYCFARSSRARSTCWYCCYLVQNIFVCTVPTRICWFCSAPRKGTKYPSCFCSNYSTTHREICNTCCAKQLPQASSKGKHPFIKIRQTA